MTCGGSQQSMITGRLASNIKTSPTNKLMKNTTILTMAALLLGSSGLMAQSTAYTKPSGFVSLGNTSGGDAVPANTDVAISIPLHQSEVKSLTVASAVSGELTVNEALVAGELLPATGAPYCVAITSGSQEGLIAVITGNTTSTIQGTVSNGGDLADVEADSRAVIFKCWTLKTLFPDDLPDGTQVHAFTGTGEGENVSSDLIYSYFGGAWYDASFVAANNVVVHPGESLIVRSGATPVSSLLITGVVPTFNHQFPIEKLLSSVGQDTRIGYFGGVGDTLGASGLGFSDGDTLLGFDNSSLGINKSASEIFTYFGGDWYNAQFIISNDYKLVGGRGYVYRRAQDAPVGAIKWSDKQEYRNNL